MGDVFNPTRESLLEAAITLFSEKGYAAVGIREIAEAAEANIASIKYHFGSKNDLYLAAVRYVMNRGVGETVWGLLDDCPTDHAVAAGRLHQFVRLFLQHLIPQGSTVETCSSLMIREALQPGEALDAIVRDYVGPNNEKLVRLLAVLVPEAGPRELEHLAGSVLGQVLHVRVFRPFVERLRHLDLSDPAALDVVARHIVTFSLRGMGLDDDCIEAALLNNGVIDMQPADGGRT